MNQGTTDTQVTEQSIERTEKQKEIHQEVLTREQRRDDPLFSSKGHASLMFR